jgi:putative ABC transport system permease protein
MEGLWIAAAGYAGGVALASIGLAVLLTYLPERWTDSVNPLDLDSRALAFMASISGIVWLLSALPTFVLVSRRDYMSLLKVQGHALTTPKAGARFRSALTIAQVALAVMLLVAGILYARSYGALLRLDKGFDSAGLVQLDMTIPPQLYPSPAERRALAGEVINRIKSRPGVIAATDASAPPSMGSSPTVAALQIDDRPPVDGIYIRPLTVDPDYFALLKIPVRAGRLFEGNESSTDVIVSETFAKRFWPGGKAVGHTFRVGLRPPSTIVGVVGHVRTEPDGTTGPSLETFQVYTVSQPLPPARPGPSQIDNTGGSYAYVAVTFRVDTAARVRDVVQAARAVDPRLPLKVEFVDDVYARLFDDRLVATQLVGMFGALAFAIAVAGVYSVMSFLVTQRTREMAIRVALGADRFAIGRLVLSGAMRLAAIGIVLGIGAAVVASRWVQSQLFGVPAIDPPTFALVALVVFALAALVTLHPVRQAVHIDPIKALRAE